MAAAAKEKPETTPEPMAPQDIAAAMLAEVRKQAAAIMEDARSASARMLEEAREQQARIVETAGDEVLTKERKLVEQAQRDFEAATSGPGRIWLQHERQEGFEPVKFVAAAGRKSVLRILRVGRYEYSHNGRTETSPGVAYQFSHGEFDALSEDVANYLRSRPGYKTLFWEAGNEPGAAPDPSVMLEKVLEAVMELDDEKLVELYEREMASHKRPLVLKQIVAGRKKIQGQGQ